jgi:hypothetical protein
VKDKSEMIEKIHFAEIQASVVIQKKVLLHITLLNLFYGSFNESWHNLQKIG